MLGAIVVGPKATADAIDSSGDALVLFFVFLGVLALAIIARFLLARLIEGSSA